jgi:hypothetical protein
MGPSETLYVRVRRGMPRLTAGCIEQDIQPWHPAMMGIAHWLTAVVSWVHVSQAWQHDRPVPC